jgi:hypothetical protein
VGILHTLNGGEKVKINVTAGKYWEISSTDLNLHNSEIAVAAHEAAQAVLCRQGATGSVFAIRKASLRATTAI